MVLEELYYGNICPFEQILPKGNGYHKLQFCEHTGVLLDKLETKLSREPMDLATTFTFN